MKIIVLTNSLDCRSGWSRYAHDVVSRIARQADVVVLCEKLDDAAISVRRVEIFRDPMLYLSNALWVLLDAWKFRRAVKRELAGQPAVIHAAIEGYAMFLPFLAGLPVKTVMTVHGTYSVLPLRSAWTRWLYRRMYRSVDRVVSVSSYTKRHLLKHASDILDEGTIRVIANGVDYEEKPERSPSTDGTFRVLTVGAVKNRKGGHHLVRVADLLKNRYKIPVRVTFVGEVQKNKSYYQEMEAFIRRHSLEDAVTFTGSITQEELDGHYRTSDLFCLFSVHGADGHYEGYPLVFHEAAMWGLPCVGTFDCGAEDAIRDGETGVLVHPEKHEEAAKAIADIYAKKTVIDPAACKRWARENDWDKKDLMEMYRW